MKTDIPNDIKDKTFRDPGRKQSLFYSGKRVHKFGWITGWTTGIMQNLRETVSTTNTEEFKGGNMQRIDHVDHTEEWVAYSSKSSFCERGDSGNWVFDDKARLVGILWGEGFDCGLMTDINTVFDVN